MPKFIFSNIIGSFVFDGNCKLIDGLLFKDFEQYKSKKEYEEKLKQKHKDISAPTEKDLYNVLLFLKDKKYHSQFHGKNLEITKNSVKESVKNDTLIIQAISSIDEIDRSINLLAKRLREWYSLYNPEVSNKIEDNEKFVSVISKNTKNQILKELNINENNSMGANLEDKDVSAILLLAAQLSNFYKLRKHYED